jgi:hypothetical protein
VTATAGVVSVDDLTKAYRRAAVDVRVKRRRPGDICSVCIGGTFGKRQPLLFRISVVSRGDNGAHAASLTASLSFDLITSVTGDLHGVLREAARQGPLATDIRSVTSEPFPATPSARYCVLLFDMDGHYRRLFARPISVLLDAEVDGRRLTRDETKAMIVNLLVAGHDTTGSQVRGTMLVARKASRNPSEFIMTGLG